MFGVRYIRIHWGDSGRYRPIWTDIARFGPILGTVYHFAECIACIVYGFRFTFITRFLLVLDQTELQGLWIEGFYWCSVRRNLELGFLEYFFREEILYEWFSISIRFAKAEKRKIRYLFQRQKCLLGCKENWHKNNDDHNIQCSLDSSNMFETKQNDIPSHPIARANSIAEE